MLQIKDILLLTVKQTKKEYEKQIIQAILYDDDLGYLEIFLNNFTCGFRYEAIFPRHTVVFVLMPPTNKSIICLGKSCSLNLTGPL